MHTSTFHNTDLGSYTFLITGGAGFIGSNVVEYLIKHKAGRVIAFDNLSTGRSSNIDPFSKQKNFAFVQADICSPDACKDACKGVDFVLHQAALGSVPRSIDNPLATHHANSTGFLNMLLAARDAKVKRFIYASSSSVYGDNTDLPKKEGRTGTPLSPYAVTKNTNEMYSSVFSSLYKMNLIGLRYFNIFGPRQNVQGPYAAAIPIFITSLLQNKQPVIHGDGKQTRDFTFVANAVQSNILALFTENKKALGQVYNIATGKNYSLLKLFSLIKKETGSGLQPLFEKERSGDVKNTLADISKAKKILGYSPMNDVEEGLRITIDWFRTIYRQ